MIASSSRVLARSIFLCLLLISSGEAQLNCLLGLGPVVCALVGMQCSACLTNSMCCPMGMNCCSVNNSPVCLTSTTKCCSNRDNTDQMVCGSSQFCCFSSSNVGRCCNYGCNQDGTCAAFTTGKITSGSITSGKITSGQITSGALTSSPLTSGPITSDQITSGQITSGALTSSAITSGLITTLNETITYFITSGVEPTTSTSENVISTQNDVMSSSSEEDTWLGTPAIAGIAAGGLVPILSSIIAFIMIRRRRVKQVADAENSLSWKPQRDPSFLRTSVVQSASVVEESQNNSEEMQSIAFQGISAKIPELKNVEIVKQLGDRIYLGVWNRTKVTLKMLKDEPEFVGFMKEAETLLTLVHPNITQFLGVYTNGSSRYIVTEYLSRGSCLEVLHNESDLTILNLIQMAISAAKGMTFLENKGILHLDLACRSLFVSVVEGKYHLKVSNFGFSRDGTDTTKIQNIPVRWSAPELFRSGKITSKSDVWSYGVVLWEIFSLGALPYQGIPNGKVFQSISEGNRLEKPTSFCPDVIYDMMRACWLDEPSDRPSFAQIANQLKGIKKSIKQMEQETEMKRKEPEYVNMNSVTIENGEHPNELDDDAPPTYNSIRGGRAFNIRQNPDGSVSLAKTSASVGQTSKPNMYSFLSGKNVHPTREIDPEYARLGRNSYDQLPPSYDHLSTYDRLSAENSYDRISENSYERMASENSYAKLSTEPYAKLCGGDGYERLSSQDTYQNLSTEDMYENIESLVPNEKSKNERPKKAKK